MRIYIILFLLLLAACGGRPGLVRHSYATNYVKGETKTSYVGQSVLRVRDYYLYLDYATKTISPTENFILNAKIPEKSSVYDFTVIGLKGKTYDAYYKERIDGVLYDIVYFTDSNGNNTYGVLIDPAGNIKTNAFYGNIVPTEFELIQPSVKFREAAVKADAFSCSMSVDPYAYTCGRANFELIYSGINKNSLNMVYREYSRDDIARTAFYQNLTYEPTAKQIMFKGFIIQIIEATNDKLVYAVVSDDLKDGEFLEGKDPAWNQILYNLQYK